MATIRGKIQYADLGGGVWRLQGDDGELYDKLSPSGRADVHVIVRPQDMLPGGFGVEVMPRAATMRWAGFPYDLRDLRGAIQVGMGDVRFELDGTHGEGGLSMRGRIPLAKQHAPQEAHGDPLASPLQRTEGLLSRVRFDQVELLGDAVPVCHGRLSLPFRCRREHRASPPAQ